jgi:hypothetical protein
MRVTIGTGLLCALLLIPFSTHAQGSGPPRSDSQPDMSGAARLKRQIVELARSFAGQGDPDFSRQRALDVLVAELLRTSPPQRPVMERLDVLAGAWKQLWGPYDYRNENRGVDPELGLNEIYQVVFREGFYYNVSPTIKKQNKDTERIVLLRGEYKPDARERNLLRVRFTNLSDVKPRPSDKQLWQLPALAESKQLPQLDAVVPGFLVKLFFGGGALEEVFTDESLRILYGSDGKDFNAKYIYVMERVM